MRSFEFGYYLEQPISQSLLMTVRALGEFRGRQALYQQQSPEILETLRRVALIQSVESSNRIEGVIVAAERLEPLVNKKVKPRDRSEAEVTGYRDVLAEIHTRANRMTLSPSLILDFHRRMFAKTPVVEDSKETYYEALQKSSGGWHEGRHDLRPWWDYFLGTLVGAYKEFEERVGTITSARGAKREMLQNAIRRLPGRFRIADLQRACPGISYPTIKRALADLKRKKEIRCLGKGRNAEWERIGS